MKSKYLKVFSIAAIIVLIDQITKFLIKTNFQLNQNFEIINFFQLKYIHNFGAGFGILQQQKWILIFISIVVVGIILFYLDRVKKKDKVVQVLAGFVLGGTLGNLIDRISYGYVIDFIDIGAWPTFNFADSFVTIGVLGLIIYFWDK
jgi:signal peptidase II